MIIKIQKPIYHLGGEPEALIYNRSKTFEQQVPLEWVESFFDPEEYKIYCKASLVRGTLKIHKKLGPQNF